MCGPIGHSALFSFEKYMHPTSITYHQLARQLEVAFDDGVHYQLPAELLRIYSPSAEVRGHSPDQAVLQTGKREVSINEIEPAGNYAIRIVFSDGHGSGLYTWEYLQRLGQEQAALWQQYDEQLQAAGVQRDAPMP